MSDRFVRNIVLFIAAATVLAVHASRSASAAEPDSLKYWILFTDKGPAEGRLAPPMTTFVSSEARERRRLRGNLESDYYDIPVFMPYIDRLREIHVRQHVISRWLNGISAYLPGDRVPEIVSMPFVRDVRPVGSAVVERVDEALDLTDHSPAPSVLSGNTHAIYGPSETQLSLVNAIPPLEQGYNGTGVRLGFLDTTFDGFSHPAFDVLRSQGRLIEVRDFTGLSQFNLHGRSVASIAAGYLDGELVGPGHGAEILAATTEYAPTETNQEEDNFVAGLEWLESMGADVVNVSLGYTTFDAGQESYTPNDLDGDTGITTRAADIAASHGVVMVISAGNWVDYLSSLGRYCASPSECWYYIGTPADGDSVIAVGAVDASGTRSPFSSFGPTTDGRTKPDVSAMGTGVYHASTSTGFSYGNGTSFSAPVVSGIAAQMLQANPNLTPNQVATILRQSASQSLSPDNALGWGIVNAEVAVAGAIAAGIEDESPHSDYHMSTYPNPFDGHLTFAVDVGTPGPASITIYDLLGREVAKPLRVNLAPGLHTITWNTAALSAGVYVFVAETPIGTRTGRVVRI
jgi:subtilisin family serine protease